MTKFVILSAAAGLAAMPAFCAAPSIAAQGVKNAASYADPELPNGPIAQGSIFNIFGSNMGPSTLAYATSLPLTTNLAGTQINVTVTGTTVLCFMIYTSAGQVAAILPSSTPVGSGTITVSYNGTPSPTAPITVVKSSFGIFTLNQQGTGQAVIQDGNYNFNSATFAFQPNETVVAWGTGLGAISGSDANTPPNGNLPGITVSVTVGGKPATVDYSGRSGYAGDDQVAFTIPPGVTGCAVPIVITAGAAGSTQVNSNYASIAIGASNTCVSSVTYPPGFQQALNGSTVRVGSVLLDRSTAPIPGQAMPIVSDGGSGGFSKVSSSVYNGSVNYDLNVGSCYIISVTGSGSSTMTPLNAGTPINVTGPNGTMQMTQLPGFVGSYSAIFGGGFTIPGQTPKPLWLSPGSYTISNGSGGPDVGPFSVTITVPANFVWTNMSQITSIDRSQPLTVTWTGGDPSAQVGIVGSSVTADRATVSFYCTAPVPAGTFTVPVQILESLPVSATVSGIPEGFVGLSTSTTTFAPNPTGLDLFIVGDSQSASVNVPFK